MIVGTLHALTADASSTRARTCRRPPTPWSSAVASSVLFTAYYLAQARHESRACSRRAASAPSNRAATGAGVASRTAMPASCRWRRRASTSGSASRWRPARTPASGAVDCFISATARQSWPAWARWRDFARTVGVTTHMLNAAEASEQRTSDAPAVARRRLFADRRHRRSRQRCTCGRAGTFEARWHGPSGLRRARHRDRGWRESPASSPRRARFERESRFWRAAPGLHRSAVSSASASRRPRCASRSSPSRATRRRCPTCSTRAGISLTRRGDGGHTLAISGRGRVDPTPQLLRFSMQFLPMFLRRWRNLAPGGMEGVRSGHEGLSRWRLDRPTPMERMRILDPAVDKRTSAA